MAKGKVGNKFWHGHGEDAKILVRLLPDRRNYRAVTEFCLDGEIDLGSLLRHLPDDSGRSLLAETILAVIRGSAIDISDIAVRMDAVTDRILVGLAPTVLLATAAWFDADRPELLEEFQVKFALQGNLSDDQVLSRGCYPDEGLATCLSYLEMLRNQYTRPDEDVCRHFEECPELYLIETLAEIAQFLSVLAEGRAWIENCGQSMER